MNEDQIIKTIMSYVVHDVEYERMQWENCNGVDKNTPYKEFLEWNESCIHLLNNGERLWMIDLCDKLNTQSVGLMDLESCGIFTAHAIYFDKNRRLCIVNPR